MSGQKLRILALHGYQQDAASFRSKCGAFRQKTKSLADYVIIDAPLIIDGDSKKRGWLYENAEASASDSSEDPTGTLGGLIMYYVSKSLIPIYQKSMRIHCTMPSGVIDITRCCVSSSVSN